MTEPRNAPENPDAGGPALLLIVLGRMLRERADAALRADGLSLRHVSALGHLAGRPGLSYSELARRAGVTVQSMQSTLAQLEERGAVERRTEPGRGRTAQLHVTDTGSRLLGRGRAVLAEADQRLLDAVGPGHDLTGALVRALGGLMAPVPR
nr:MarR family transcriptional regulator [Amycolatopsis suaedae]